MQVYSVSCQKADIKNPRARTVEMVAPATQGEYPNYGTKVFRMCPISHKLCKLCALFRGRHYYALRSCKEYMHRLHEAAASRADR